jgi:hypothetical protein
MPCEPVSVFSTPFREQAALNGLTNPTETRAGRNGVIIRTENIDAQSEQKIVINIDLTGLMGGSDTVSNIFLEDRDIVYIPPVKYFYIIGEVKKPGAFPYTAGKISLVEAISIAGGFTPIASRNKNPYHSHR